MTTQEGLRPQEDHVHWGLEKKGHILQDRKAYAESGLSTSDLSWAEQLVTGTWKEPAEPVYVGSSLGKKISWLSFCRQRASNEVSRVPSHVLSITFSSARDSKASYRGAKCVWERLEEVVMKKWIVLLFHWPLLLSTLTLAVTVLKSGEHSGGGGKSYWQWLPKSCHQTRSSEKKGLNLHRSEGIFQP